MDRADRTGLGIAVVAHAALFAALSLNLLKPPALPRLDTDPIDVSIVDAAGLESASPDPTPAATAPAPAPAPVEEAAPAPEEYTPPPPPQPVAKSQPTPKPVVKPAPPKAQPKPAKPVAKSAPTKRPGLSRDLLAGLEDSPAPGKSVRPQPTRATGVSAAQMTGAQKASLNALIYRQLKPFWKPPSGADAEQLVTLLDVRLNRDGSLAGDPEIIAQQGINDSNRAQAKLHAERAIQAVRRAAPFDLPSEYYDAWKWLKPLKLYVGQPG